MKQLALIILLSAITLFSQRLDNRRHQDSLNTIIEPIRTNQAGYRTSDNIKRAIIELDKPNLDQHFILINDNNKEVFKGELKYLGDYKALNGDIEIKAYHKSINVLYSMKSTSDNQEFLYEADFGDFKTDGTYRLAVEDDTSYPFEIKETLYNDIMEYSLQFFGVQRSGDNNSWFHPKSNMMDGSARGPGKEGSLSGGWYDCGDHFKVAQTTAYAFTNLTLAYLFWPEKAEDRFGHSYSQKAPRANDGIPDILWEAKIGADYIYKLYLASKEDGLIKEHDMYQQVGVTEWDHKLWVQPEYRDYVPEELGGPNRKIDADIGPDMAGQFAGTLALFSSAWKKYDAEYAALLLEASKEIYEKLVIHNIEGKNYWDWPKSYSNVQFYPQQTRIDDDVAMGALGLWYATKDDQYKHDLLENEDYGKNLNHGFPGNEHIFPAGLLSSDPSGFYPGGWVSDYQNIHPQVASALYMLIVRDEDVAKEYGLSTDDQEQLRETILALLTQKTIAEGYTNQVDSTLSADNLYESVKIVDNLKVAKPYNLRWTSVAWGFNRYNMGAVTAVALASEILSDINDPKAEQYQQVVIDNLDYVLGKNPWNISFIMGAGDKHLQHIHHRNANPDGYNGGAIPYDYREPTGAFMGGAAPGSLLIESFPEYVVTETCIDYSSQLLFVAQQLSKKLPRDTKDPELFTVIANPVEETSATIRWEFNELTNDQLELYTDTNSSSILDTLVTSQASKTWILNNLEPNTKYWVKLQGTDIADNRDQWQWHSFKTSKAPIEPTWESVDACNISHNDATVAWWSPNQFISSGINLSTNSDLSRSLFIEEHSFGAFHQIVADELLPNTTYYYDRVSGSAIDDNDGKHYTFKTREAFVDYSIYVKPINKNYQPHFVVSIVNNELIPYADLEMRLYLTIDAESPEEIKPFITNMQLFKVDGLAGGSIVMEAGELVDIDVSNNEYYLPITIKDTLPVGGRASYELEFRRFDKDGAQTGIDKDALINSWSFRAHNDSKNDPILEDGVNWAMMSEFSSTNDWEVVDGVPYLSFQENHYIPVFYKGSHHVYGYAPDFENPLSLKTFELETNAPFFMDAEKAWVYNDQNPTLSGSATVLPYGDITNIEVNGDRQNIDSDQTVAFSIDVNDIPNFDPLTELVVWSDKGTEECSFTYKRWLIDYDDEKPSSSEEEKEELSSAEIESSSEEIETTESSTEEVSSEEEPIHFDPPKEVIEGDFSLLFQKNLYISEEPEFIREENISLEQYDDNHSFTIEVSDIPPNAEEYTLRFVGAIYSIEGLFIEEFDLSLEGDSFEIGEEYSFQWNNRDVNGNLLDQKGRLLGSGIYLMNFHYTSSGPTGTVQTQMFVKMGYLRMF
ncbi:MAG: glycoside hydrolase family 9 protein [Fibrobacterales bacterium]